MSPRKPLEIHVRFHDDVVHGNGIPTGIPWEMSHGKGGDGTARIAIPMGHGNQYRGYCLKPFCG
ncbi:unnamed protein product [Clavelina lepadiformis]|uniref:Uncharacterized protein n=1 Tax=Clavelina lepadiformis TaxID=159417 RepID=A0ABP0FID0_CLALP